MMEVAPPPPWFWKVVVTIVAGSLFTLVSAGSTAGEFLGETRMWMQKSDERFYKHLEADKQRADDLGAVLRDVLDRMVESNERSLMAATRAQNVDERLDRVEDSLRTR
jgi:hypothetical protein